MFTLHRVEMGISTKTWSSGCGGCGGNKGTHCVRDHDWCFHKEEWPLIKSPFLYLLYQDVIVTVKSCPPIEFNLLCLMLGVGLLRGHYFK